MNEKRYIATDTNPMSWEEFGEILDTLIGKLDAYQKKHNVRFDIVVPILRSWGIPATAIANRFRIVHMLPVQIKVERMFSLPELLQPVPAHPNILICETNTATGDTAKKAIALIQERYPSSKIYYTSVAKVYWGPEIFEGIEEYFWGIQTDEFFMATESEMQQRQLRPKITIFPWETIEYELSDINHDG